VLLDRLRVLLLLLDRDIDDLSLFDDLMLFPSASSDRTLDRDLDDLTLFDDLVLFPSAPSDLTLDRDLDDLPLFDDLMLFPSTSSDPTGVSGAPRTFDVDLDLDLMGLEDFDLTFVVDLDRGGRALERGGRVLE